MQFLSDLASAPSSSHFILPPVAAKTTLLVYGVPASKRRGDTEHSRTLSHSFSSLCPRGESRAQKTRIQKYGKSPIMLFPTHHKLVLKPKSRKTQSLHDFSHTLSFQRCSSKRKTHNGVLIEATFEVSPWSPH